MNNLNRQIIHVSHNDSDGIGCTVLSQYYGNKRNMEVIAINTGYSRVAEELNKALDLVESNPDKVEYFLISDISMKYGSKIDERVDYLAKKYPHITFRLLDHHATAHWLNKYDWAEVHEKDEQGVKHCGTYWVAKFYAEIFGSDNNIIVREFVEYTDLYDTWRWVEDFPQDEPFTPANNLNKLLLLKGAKRHAADLLDRLINHQPTLFSYDDRVILNMDTHNTQTLIDTKDRELISGTFVYSIRNQEQLAFVFRYFKNLYHDDADKFQKAMKRFHVGYKKKFHLGVVYLNSNISEVGNALAKRHPELDFICLINMPSTISYRCVKDLEVPLGVIANAFSKGNGGGHPKSSGSTLNEYMVFDVSKQLLPGFINTKS